MADDIDKILSQESSKYGKDVEIARILSTFKLDSYAILDLQPGCTPADIKQQYRRKSLLIHPDKTTNPDAPDAFDLLKKAEAELMDDKKRELLDEAIADARKLLIRERGWTINDERLKGTEFLKDWRDKTKIVLVETELRRRKQAKAQMQEEGREKARIEKEAEERKKKRDADKVWEETRDERINNWRDFKKTTDKKKKRKMNVLG
ncbi:DnaJ-domain-containing protein [Lipomyces japonicus]|uniref:DnaJ-domain-containing protein n=1 Tax=Lipomyces japonicus TaxID=56871 RepID=UPI0034CFCC64